MPKLSFGDALTELKRGAKVARDGWLGDGKFIFLVHPVSIEYPSKINDAHIDFAEFMPDCIAMITSNHDLQLGWLASQADMLSDDWCVVPNTK